MKELFTIDYKDYDSSWKTSSRPSARAIILLDGKIDGAGREKSENCGQPTHSENSKNHKEALLSPDYKIPLVYAKKLGYYKFPGGGIKEGEDNVAALSREVGEETGLQVIKESVKEYGLVRRLQASPLFPETIFIQNSFHYFCQVQKNADGSPLIKKQTLDSYEKDDGFELRIVSLREAIENNIHFKSDKIEKLIMIAREVHVMEGLCGLPDIMPRAYAEALLEAGVAKNPGPWREHSYAVAAAAEKIARAVNEKSGHQQLNPDLAYTLGLLHDIGRQEGYTYLAHVYDGYHYLKNLGWETAAKICLTHSFNLHTTEDYIGKIDISPAQLEEIKELLAATEYDDYDRLIQLLDGTCAADGTKNLEERMSDVKARYGYYPQGKWDKNFELKTYFEKLSGRDLYQIIK
ncbi:MAG: HD domain-containing protein [Treponema sp.]|nr:HD domain-containing protein [Treponema sp.]